MLLHWKTGLDVSVNWSECAVLEDLLIGTVLLIVHQWETGCFSVTALVVLSTGAERRPMENKLYIAEYTELATGTECQPMGNRVHIAAREEPITETERQPVCI